MARGDIYYVNLLSPPGGSGHEQTGIRPVIVISSDQTSDQNPMVTVVPLTGKLAASRFPHTISIDPTSSNGLSTPSVAMAFQVTSLDKRRLVRRTGKLEENYLDQVESELESLLNLT